MVGNSKSVQRDVEHNQIGKLGDSCILLVAMTLQQAIKTYQVPGLNFDGLADMGDQNRAFATCLSFLKGMEKTKRQNKRHNSGTLKHLVENPTNDGRLVIAKAYTCYVYEGTFILAALASGFTMHRPGKAITATFNISERSLKDRCTKIRAAYRTDDDE